MFILVPEVCLFSTDIIESRQHEISNEFRLIYSSEEVLFHQNKGNEIKQDTLTRTTVTKYVLQREKRNF